MGNNRNYHLPLVSVIIPIYNASKTLAKCLDSVLHQTYKNIEIVCVNDGSNDSSLDIINSYRHKYKNITLVNNPRNLGLIATRINGVKMARGKYICFVDSDDLITIDWVRLLLINIEDKHSDFAIGNTFLSYPDNTYIYNHRSSLTFNRMPISGQFIFKEFMDNNLYNFVWQTIWNKMYNKSFWNRCVPYFPRSDLGITMHEDLAIAFPLYFFANKISFVDADTYFYCINPDSTMHCNEIEKNERNIRDGVYVLNYLKQFLKRNNVYDIYRCDLERMDDLVFAIFCHHLKQHNLLNDKTIKNMLSSHFPTKPIKDVDFDAEEFRFYSIKTKWNNYLERLRIFVAKKETKIVAFTLATLFTLPFFAIKDIKEFAKHSSCEIDNLVIKFSHIRNYGKEIYDLANIFHKKIVIINNTDFNNTLVKKILAKHGYSNFSKIINHNKARDAVYINETDSTSKFKHQFLLSNPIDFLTNKCPEGGPKDLYVLNIKEVKAKTAKFSSVSSLPYRSAHAILANDLFDKPVLWNNQYRYNGNFYIIGQYCFGFEMLRLASNLYRKCLTDNYKKIVFNCSQTFLLKKSFDIMCQFCGKQIKSQSNSSNSQTAIYAETSHKRSVKLFDKTKFDNFMYQYFCSEIPSNKLNKYEGYVLKEIQRGAIDFITNYCKTFADYPFMFDFKNETIFTLPLYSFIFNIPSLDKQQFKDCYHHKNKLVDLWNKSSTKLKSFKVIF